MNCNLDIYRTVSTESSPPVLTPHHDTSEDPDSSGFRRSLSPFPSYHPVSTGPPSYTSVFNSEPENVTPPPQYNNLEQV